MSLLHLLESGRSWLLGVGMFERLSGSLERGATQCDGRDSLLYGRDRRFLAPQRFHFSFIKSLPAFEKTDLFG